MKKEIPTPALVAIVLVVLVVVAGIGWYTINRDTGIVRATPDVIPGKKGKQPIMFSGGGGGNAGMSHRALMKPNGF